MIVSPLERIDFISKIGEMGFSYFDETIPSGKYSFTMMFYKNMKCTLFASPNSGYRENRSILYFVEGIYVNGTHFPQESDTKFLNAVEMFCKARKNDKVIIIGDLNANDVSRGNKQLVERLKTYGYVDVWVQKGNPERCIRDRYDTAYRRMEWDKPAPTLTQNFLFEASDKKVHPSQTRVLSIYEALVLQTIAEYDFRMMIDGKYISKNLCAEVIGESVPPRLIEIICKQIKKISI